MKIIRHFFSVPLIFCLSMFFTCVAESYASCPSIAADCYTGTNPKTVIDCSYAAVNATVGAASSGDTIIVPAGTATWSSQLVITKGMTLKGAGAGQTIITGNVGKDYTANTYMIKYQPANPALNEAFRLTGFTFDMNNNSKGVILLNGTTNVLNKIRIDHNEFLNMFSFSYPSMEVNGQCYGVIDHNTFSPKSHISFYGKQATSWSNPPEGANTPYAYGTINNMYVEDNTFASNYGFQAGGQGGRYVARYNTYNYTNTAGLFPWFDAHGNMPSGVYGMMGTEFYGNSLVVNGMNLGNGVRAFDHRGGKALFFYNSASGATLTTTPHILTREEYDDGLYQATNTQPQHVSDSYYWCNWKGATAFTLSIENWVPGGICGSAVYPAGNCPSYSINENSDFYNYKPAFDGTTGVGCGTLAARPATCTTGVGYWATTQSCSDLTGMVGALPATKISGTLYKCTSTDTWTAYYTPYTYPHPLTAPYPAMNLRIVQ